MNDHTHTAAPVSAADREAPPVPPRAPLAMPVQALRAFQTPGIAANRPTVRTVLARLTIFGGALLVTVFATDQMIKVVAVEQPTVLQWTLVILFVISFAWIALAAASSLAGLFFYGGGRYDESKAPLTGKTALVMPVYNEDPSDTAAALAAMAAALAEKGYGDAFEIFILSDTTSPEIWLQETATLQALRRYLAGKMAVWYRRRYRNTARKAGNLQDFVEAWGGRYEYMIVLDADSIMAPETLVTLVRRMQADPSLGLLQTVPMLAGGQGLLARLQQFAGWVYGPVVARGLAAWQGDDGNYWGHNAIIRVCAFAQACGLPQLSGRKPFGGPILSHDFVEAALLRRAGWAVRMAPELGGSWEDSPPSLLDVAARDRRWAQGNLQHLKVLPARGLVWPSRVHFLTGVMSYLASPLWLALIATGVLLTVQAKLIRPEYFADDFQLFPSWPRFDAERMIWLFVFTLVVLLLPKIIGLCRVLGSRELRRRAGGAMALLAGAAVEILLSALYAPVMMLIQSRQVWEILRGRDSGWATQRRGEATTPWREVLQRHWLHTLIGLGLTIVLWRLSPPLLAWMSPTLSGLLLALPLSKTSGSYRAGEALKRIGLLTTPEENLPPDVMIRRARIATTLRQAIAGVSVTALLADKRLCDTHFRYILPPPQARRGQPDLDKLAATAKLEQAGSAEEALGWLNRGELLAVLAHRDLFQKLCSY